MIKNLKLLSAAMLLTLIAGCATNNPTKSSTKTLTINTSKENCELLENGSGYKASPVRFKGKIWKTDGESYSCSVEIPEAKFKEQVGSVCMLSAFNSASSYFYKGEPTLLRKQSCTFYQLRNGNYYFDTTGISSDSCSWTCF